MGACTAHIRFWGESGHAILHCTCLLLTQSGHAASIDTARHWTINSNQNRMGQGDFMAEARVERRLAAILAADVAGYSRLMGVDEEGTLTALKAHRREIVDPK